MQDEEHVGSHFKVSSSKGVLFAHDVCVCGEMRLKIPMEWNGIS